MTKKNLKTEIVQRADPKTTRSATAQPKAGDWYYLKIVEHDKGVEKQVERLRCITHIGSNYVSFTSPWGTTTRVHFDEFATLARPEPEADAVIAGYIEEYRQEMRQLMGRVKELMSSLAITPQGELAPQQETAALVLAGSTTSMKDYKKALVKAKEKTLPELFKKIKKANEGMATWMKAQTLPFEGEIDRMETSVGAIEERVFNVELYAGLVEEVAQIREGEPAASDERVHLLQRRHYMDEECLVNYEFGGMEFANWKSFNKWLCRDENFHRIFPFPRCVVAFQVRRNRKDRPDLDMFIKIKLEDADKLTFLYLRNGDQLHALSTKIKFGEQLFPDVERNVLASGGILWAKSATSGARWIKGLVTHEMYQGYVEDLAAAEAAMAEVEARRKAEKWGNLWDEERSKDEARRKLGHERSMLVHNLEWKVREARDKVSELTKFTPESVYYDDIAEYVRQKMLEHNRLVLILQGLFDRSPVFHPHPTYKLWEQDSYEQALKLVFDESRALAPGEAPSFRAYVRELNEKLCVGSVTIGQEDFWFRKEADKENARRDRRGRSSYNDRDVERYSPYGNNGPGTLAVVEKLSRDKKTAHYSWTRERQNWRSYKKDPLPCALGVPVGELFNVSAYTPGDFKRFYNDPRTRAKYLDWAPVLLTAEDYHAGKAKIGVAGSTYSIISPALSGDDAPTLDDEDEED